MKDRFSRRVHLPLPRSLLAAVLLAGGITLLALWCQPNSFRYLAGRLVHQPLLIVLNALPIGLLVLAAACLLRNVFFGAALVNFLAGGLSIANRMKIEVRDEPVFPRDFALLKEVGSALGSYDIPFPAAQILAVVLATLILAALGFFIAGEPFPIEKLRGWRGSLLGTAASLAVLTGLILTVYASGDLYQSFQVTNPDYVPSVFNDLGFPYAFCRHFTTYLVDRPEGFSRAMAEAWETGDRPGLETGKPVSVVMVMNEAFSDITDADIFRYTEEDDPLPNLHALRQDPHTLSGHVVVPGFAGGTANTEFDVLTGMQTNALSDSATSAMRVVNRNLDSLFRVFAADGYATSFYHPGDNWFYNRENIYRWLGAEETRFIGDMEDPEYKGRWVTDDYAAGLIEDLFEEAEGPVFHYTTTIQNHMSYTADKYGPDYDFPLVNIPGLSEEAETLLRVYAEGVRDADAMLGRLWNYFDAREEPVVLVYWGDHLPYLGDNQLGYRQLGLDVFSGPEGLENLSAYKTPYVIWANGAAAELLDWESAVKSLDLPESVSASFLGAAVLELTGRRDESAWFSFLNDLRRELPVVQKNVCQLSDGSVTGEITEQQRDLLQKWRRWSYYKLQYKEVS